MAREESAAQLEREAIVFHGGAAIFGRIDVEKALLGEAGRCQLGLLEHPEREASKGRVDLVLPCSQRLLSGGKEGGSIDGAKRLKSAASLGNGDDRIVIFRGAQEKIE